MITFIRSAAISQGTQAPDAFEWAVKIAHHLNNNWGSNIQVHSGIGGKVQQVHWIGTYDSLAHLEEMAAKFAADSDYAAILAEVTNLSLYSSESVIDQIYSTV